MWFSLKRAGAQPVGEAHLPEHPAACAFHGLFPYILKHCSCQGGVGALLIREFGGCLE